MLSIPPDLSETGKRQQLFYPTQKEAQTASEQIKTRKRNFGDSLTLLNSVRMNEAAQAFSLIDAAGVKVSLLSLVREGLVRHHKRSQSATLEALFASYIDARQTKTWHHTDKLKSCCKRFCVGERGRVLVSDLGHEDFERELNTLTPSMRNAQLRLLRSVLNYGVKRGYLETNPLDRLEFADIPKKEVQTIPAGTVEAMLRDAAENDKALLPFLVFGFFCGVRPIGELQKLRWSDVSIEERTLTIRAEVSKTGTRRFVQLSENAIAWLKLSLASTHSSSLIMPMSFGELRGKREALWSRVGNGANWIHQGMRHTFCSCWLAMHKDVNTLLLMSGHTSSQMLWRRYNRGTEKAEAEKFWCIFPPKHEERKIVAFPAASS
jgi:integrase